MRRRPSFVHAFSSRQLAWTAGVCAGIFVLLALGVHQVWPLDPLDKAIEGLIQGLRADWLYPVMLVITALGDGLFITLVSVVTVAAFLFTGARWRGFCYATCFIALPLAVRAIKFLMARARPEDLPYTGIHLYSFPSGHSANSALVYGAIAGLTFVALRGPLRYGLTAAFLLLPLMIGISRIYLGAHWFSDVIAGYSLAGLFLVLLAVMVAKHPEPPRYSRGIPVALFLIAAAFPVYLMLSLPDAEALYRAIELHQAPEPDASP